MPESFLYAHYNNSVDIGNNYSGELPDIFNRHLDTVGDGSGAKDAIGDYSSAEEKFILAPAAGEIMRVARLIGSSNDKFEVILNDDFSDLIHQHFLMQGYYE